MKKIFVLILIVMFGIFAFTGCAQGGLIPDKQDKIEYVAIQHRGDYWTEYTNIKSYHLNGDIAVIEFNDGSMIITHIENVVIKLKGE